MDKELSGADRRRYPRFHINQSINVSIGREKSLIVSGQNISEGGLLCECDEFVEPYTHVFVVIESPPMDGGQETEREPYRLRVEGVVLRCESVPSVVSSSVYNMGIEFTGLFDDSIEKLRSFVSPLSEV